MSIQANVVAAINPTAINPGWQAITPGAVKTVAIGATSVQSSVFSANVSLVELTPTSDCFVLFGANPTVTTATGFFCQAGVSKNYGVTAGQKLAVIQSSASGSLYVTEAAS